MTHNLQDRVALVTGASSGIGEATARRLAASGAAVAVVARRGNRLDALVETIAEAGGRALALPADITDTEQARGVVQAAVDHFGRLDILINNAGVMVVGAAADQSLEDWGRMIDLNQRALLAMTQAALPHLEAAARDQKDRVADIVNISSLAGRAAMANFAVYNMTKFGVTGFSEALAQELAARHVRVGVVQPGAVKTELNDHHIPAVREQIDAFFASIEALEPEDIAEGVAFMVSRPRHASVRELWMMPTEQGGGL